MFSCLPLSPPFSFSPPFLSPPPTHAHDWQNVVNEESLAGDLKKVTFARSPVMSSYLLAFIVGEYDYVEATDANGVLVRVYTPLGKADQGKFALDVSHWPFFGFFVRFGKETRGKKKIMGTILSALKLVKFFRLKILAPPPPPPPPPKKKKKNLIDIMKLISL